MTGEKRRNACNARRSDGRGALKPLELASTLRGESTRERLKSLRYEPTKVSMDNPIMGNRTKRKARPGATSNSNSGRSTPMPTTTATTHTLPLLLLVRPPLHRKTYQVLDTRKQPEPLMMKLRHRRPAKEVSYARGQVSDVTRCRRYQRRRSWRRFSICSMKLNKSPRRVRVSSSVLYQDCLFVGL